MAVQNSYTWDQLQRHIKALYAAKRSYRRIALEDYDGKVNHGVIQRVIKGIEPKSSRIRAKLHMVSLALAETCPHCGGVHTTKRCPNRKKGGRDLFSLPVKTLRAMIQHREAF